MRKIGITNVDHVRVATANRSIVLVGLACLLTLCVAMPARAGQIKTVFVIAFENHNWTQPASQHNPGSILGNRNAPYINSLVQHGNPNAAQVSYASNYLNAGPAIHPSEANYIWSEAGSNRPSRCVHLAAAGRGKRPTIPRRNIVGRAFPCPEIRHPYPHAEDHSSGFRSTSRT